MECRLARASDKDAILQSFPGIYGGRDYLATKYDTFIKRERYTCFVGEIDQQIVAFTYTFLLDRGQSYLTGGLRVHMNYRRQGLMHQIIPFSDSYMQQDGNKRIVAKQIVYLSNEEVLERIKRHPERHITGTRATFWYTFGMAKMQEAMSLFQKPDSTKHSHCSIMETSEMDSGHENTMKATFSAYCDQSSNRCLNVYWTPYDNEDSNWDEVLDDTAWIAMSQIPANDHKMESLTLVQWRYCELGVTYHLDFLAKEQKTFSSEYLAHILNKICLEQTGFCGDISLMAFCDEYMENDINSKVASLLGRSHKEKPETVFFIKENI